MDDWSEIRRQVLVERVSQRRILRKQMMHWRTLGKIRGRTAMQEHGAPATRRDHEPEFIACFVQRLLKDKG